MHKVLVIDYKKCTGCRACEMACSLQHEGIVNPVLSRIQAITLDVEGKGIPIVCTQCEPAPCIDICPTNARHRDLETRKVVTDEKRCIKCRVCMTICPFGAIGFDPIERKIFSCDLCGDTPQCVDFCTYGAIHYMDESEVNRRLARAAATEIPTHIVVDKNVT